MALLNNTVQRAAQYLCRYRGKPVIESLVKITDLFQWSLHNEKFAMKHNGELRVLRIVTALDPKVMFDVGANEGEWTKIASELAPSSTIHAFEIVPSTYDDLLKSTTHLKNVVQIDHGLSNMEGDISVSIGRHSTTATGCKMDVISPDNNNYNQQINCKVKKASDYLKEQEITSLDFVKIDVEGMDFKVIQGFEHLIRNVRAIQFEYGKFNIFSHDLLADFYSYLTNHGFVIGKIFPRHVKFSAFNLRMENFYGSNYIAVRSDQKELIKALGKFSK